MLVKKMLFFVLVLMVSIPLVSYAQDAKEIIPETVWTAGQIDPTEHTVFYSVLMTSGETALSDLTISATLPEGATFVKDFWLPEAATFVGEKDGVVSWTLPAADADTVTGPFTFVASFEDSDSEEFAPPASFKASVTSSAGTVENEVTDDTIVALTDEGSLELPAEGLLDFTAVEETGFWLYAPADTVAAPVTLNFQRLPIDKDAKLPETAEETWWCGFVSLSASEDVAFAKPIIMVVPLLRAATPGLVMPVFAQVGDGDWTLISADNTVTSLYSEGDETAAAFAKISPTGTEAYIMLNGAQLKTTPINLAVGVAAKARKTSKSGTGSVAGEDQAPWF